MPDVCYRSISLDDPVELPNEIWLSARPDYVAPPPEVGVSKTPKFAKPRDVDGEDDDSDGDGIASSSSSSSDDDDAAPDALPLGHKSLARRRGANAELGLGAANPNRKRRAARGPDTHFALCLARELWSSPARGSRENRPKSAP